MGGKYISLLGKILSLTMLINEAKKRREKMAEGERI